MKDARPEPLEVQKIVRPRHRKPRRMPVVAIGDTAAWIDENGKVGPISELLTALPATPTLFAKVNAADFIALLDEHYRKTHPTTWQWWAHENERAIRNPDGLKIAARVTVAIHSFGFKGKGYHRIIDPITMYGKGLDDIWPGDEPPIQKLLEWAQQIRNFCHDNQMEVRPTIGAISTQFLTDHRFYPNDRRKVPRATNDTARTHQPGNHYALYVHPAPHKEFTAWYIDQTRAHHYHARTAALPDADSLYAYGWFADLDGIAFDKPESDFHGLLCLDLELPKELDQFTWIRRNGKHHFVFTNEVPHLLDMGYRVRGEIAAWGSFKQDTGLAKYAIFADQQLDKYDANNAWLKPLLLATYGTLSTRAGTAGTVFRMASKGERVQLVTGHRTLTGKLVRPPKRLEPKIANVLHRGMIEAATRSDSVGLAQHLAAQGYTILSIYADAIIVKQDEEHTSLPILPEPWRIKDTLNYLRFINKQAFISSEMTKLPGVSRELQQYTTRGTQRVKALKYEALTGRRI